MQAGHTLTVADIATYHDHILGGKTQLPTLGCTDFDSGRYSSLQKDGAGLHWYFALDLRKCLSILPQLLGSIIEAIKYLGPACCVLSIVEGNSHDGTNDVLSSLRAKLEIHGIRYFFQSSSIDPTQGNRIRKLADLRNLALEPLL